MIGALIGHLVGDYLLQNDWMAGNKKKAGAEGFRACLVHCVLWTFSVMICSGWLWQLDSNIYWWFGVFFWLGGTHFIQDRTTIIDTYMRRCGQRKFLEGPCAPWSGIVVDNVWHILEIWAAYLAISWYF